MRGLIFFQGDSGWNFFSGGYHTDCQGRLCLHHPCEGSGSEDVGCSPSDPWPGLLICLTDLRRFIQPTEENHVVCLFGTNNGMGISSCLYFPSSEGPLFSLPLFGSLSPRPIPPPKDSLASPVQQRPCLKSLSLVPYDHRPSTFISTHPVQLGDAHAGSCERWFGSPFHWVKKLTASGLEKPPIRTMLRRARQFQIRSPTVTKDCESLALVCVFKCHSDIIIVFLNNKLASFQVLSIFGCHPHFGIH